MLTSAPFLYRMRSARSWRAAESRERIVSEPPLPWAARQQDTSARLRNVARARPSRAAANSRRRSARCGRLSATASICAKGGHCSAHPMSFAGAAWGGSNSKAVARGMHAGRTARASLPVPNVCQDIGGREGAVVLPLLWHSLRSWLIFNRCEAGKPGREAGPTVAPNSEATAEGRAAYRGLSGDEEHGNCICNLQFAKWGRGICDCNW